jgi:hypothetical protein
MVPEYRPDALVQLCHVLVPDDPSLADEVALASHDAQAYYVRFEARLQDDRGFEPDDVPFPELPWIAMLDGLRDRQRLAEVDWRADAGSVMDDVDRLIGDRRSVAQRWTWVDAEHWNQLLTGEFLQAVGDQLLRTGRMLAQFSEDSDSYPITVIDPDQLAELQRLARHSGYGDVQPLASAIPQHFDLGQSPTA